MASAQRPLPEGELEAVVDADEVRWRAASGARALILGGAGFFASWMIESFLRANRRLNLGMRLDVLSRAPQGFYAKLPHLAAEDSLRVLDYEAVTPQTVGVYDFALHLAYEIDPRLAAEPTREPRLPGVELLLAAAARSPRARLLYASSGCVYGAPSPGQMRWSEQDEPRPLEANGRSKLYAERRLRPAGCVMARGFAFAGPGLRLNGDFAFGNFLADALAGRPIEIKGDGRPLRSYLYASEMAIWLWRLLFAGRRGQAYNVGGEEACSIEELARAVADELHPGLPIRVAQAAGDDEAPRYLPSTAKARAELGLRCDIPLPEAIRRHAQWLRQ